MAGFDKKAFSEKLKKILTNYDSITEMANNIEMDRGYLSKYLSRKIENPPSEKILQKIAKCSNGETDIQELFGICGFYNMIEEQELLVNGNIKYVDILFENMNLDNKQKIDKIKELIKDMELYIKDCEKQKEYLEKNELYKIIKADTINMQKEEIRRSKEKIQGLKKLVQQLEKNNH